jgi:N-acetylglucosamine-6-phosphate deacetylase
MNLLTIHNARVTSPCGILDRGIVVVEGSKISAIAEGTPQQLSGRAIDVHGVYLAPGFIEPHEHGGDGVDFMDATPEAFEAITRFHATRGVTTLPATTAAAPLPELVQVLEATRQWKQSAHEPGAQVLGVHLEGPFLNIKQRGVHLAQNVRNPSAATESHY